MTWQRFVHFLLLSGAVLCAWPARGLGQPSGQKIKDEIIAAWRLRQEKAQSAHVEVRCSDMLHKGAIDFMGLRKSPSVESTPNPPRDFPVESSCSIWLSASRISYVEDRPLWDPGQREFHPQHYENVYDGQLTRYLRNPASATYSYPQSSVKPVSRSDIPTYFAIQPVFLCIRGAQDFRLDELARMQPTGRTVNVKGRPCVELSRNAQSSGQREFMYFDAQRDYVLVKKAILVGDQPSWQLEIEYSPDPTVGWFPRTWEWLIQGGRPMQAQESGRRSVTSYQLNAEIPDDRFQIVLPPGTRVLDETSGSEVQYVIRERGERGTAIPLSANPTYEDLLAARPGNPPNTKSYRVIIALSLIAAIGVVCLLLVVRQRRAR
jgi:hypothetical protein